MKPIYMDHHATTPLLPEVLDAMMPYLTEEFGNPSSTTHVYGTAARRAVERAREQVAALVGAASPEEIIFTSGATESDNLALKGVAHQLKGKGTRIITIATEHKAVLDTAKKLQKEGFEVVFAPIDEHGVVVLDALRDLLDESTILVSIQYANSEIGTVQPIAAIGEMTKERGILFHSDAVQALARVPVDVQREHIDLLSISGHKIYGPKGVGALYVRKGVKLVAQMDGGGHERGYRSGTLNVPGIVGLGKAAEIGKRDLEAEAARLLQLRERLRKGIESSVEHVKLNGHPTQRLPNNLNYSFAFVEGESLILALKEFALSTGSACTSASLQSSYVLRAIGVPESLAHCSLRFGLGRSNTPEHVDLLVERLKTSVAKLREMSPLYEMAKEGVDIESLSWGKHRH
ncbi:MAG: IscS subfamily cysteine desulfurase [candidate division KSB1 bacterium]|nr:IscS subfamily cysteine desulfurase [candidate division KSB1 bacterium]MDZ7378274.1 IscS subfamily cysteine desulfurase [candidate division KSB1 bacterium]MDZ7392688.1 IscS subfamily cysteine desulfurase [candidate division KSB1 bacterium]MDZ7413116.1 IscS subfamily cysteine desulfurase [candidate division KSB1 bacterium]